MKYSIKKFVLASMLASISIILNLIPAYFSPFKSIQLPFYQIPLVLAGIYLGKNYIIYIALIADLGIGMLNPTGYLPLFIFSKLAWGFIPAIFLYKRNYNIIFLSLVVLFSYLLATTLNGFAIYVYFGRSIFKFSFIYRLIQFVLFSPIIIFYVQFIVSRLNNTGYQRLEKFLLFSNKNQIFKTLII